MSILTFQLIRPKVLVFLDSSLNLISYTQTLTNSLFYFYSVCRFWPLFTISNATTQVKATSAFTRITAGVAQLLSLLCPCHPPSVLVSLQSPFNAGVVIPLRIILISASNLPMASHLTQNKGQIFAMTFKALHNLVEGPYELTPDLYYPHLSDLLSYYSSLAIFSLALASLLPLSITGLFPLQSPCICYYSTWTTFAWDIWMSVPSFPSILCKKSPSQKSLLWPPYFTLQWPLQ